MYIINISYLKMIGTIVGNHIKTQSVLRDSFHLAG